MHISRKVDVAAAKIHPGYNKTKYIYIYEIRRVESIKGRQINRTQYRWEKEESKSVKYDVVAEGSFGQRLNLENELYETEQEAIDAVLKDKILKCEGYQEQRYRYMIVCNEDGTERTYKLTYDDEQERTTSHLGLKL